MTLGVDGVASQSTGTEESSSRWWCGIPPACASWDSQFPMVADFFGNTKHSWHCRFLMKLDEIGNLRFGMIWSRPWQIHLFIFIQSTPGPSCSHEMPIKWINSSPMLCTDPLSTISMGWMPTPDLQLINRMVTKIGDHPNWTLPAIWTPRWGVSPLWAIGTLPDSNTVINFEVVFLAIS